MKLPMILVLGIFLGGMAQAHAVTAPDPHFTPGTLCSDHDDDFDYYDYPEKIARCARNVSQEEKQEVAREYGDIPRSRWSKYEFDHLIPLCAGGANDIRNIWPQPLAEAHEKDRLENEVCTGMRNGTMTQAETVARVHEWFDERAAGARGVASDPRAALAEERQASP